MRTVVPKLSSGGVARSVFFMNALQTTAFGQLLSAWRRRDDARHSDDVRQLGEARMDLERARAHMRSAMVSPR